MLNVEALDFDCLISYCVSWTFRPFFLSSTCIVLPTIVKEAGWSTKSSPSDRSQICRFDFQAANKTIKAKKICIYVFQL